MISPEEKAKFERIASMSSWDIAKHYGCSFSGDCNPIEHGGFFYDSRDWEAYGYASCVEFWDDHENGCLIVQRGTIQKPSQPEDMNSAFRCIGMAVDDENRENIHAQIEAVRYYCGIEPDGTSYPDLKNFDLDQWQEWRIWRSIEGYIQPLGD